MDILYRSIATKLKADIPELRWIDLDAGQIDYPQKNYPVQFPAVLIDFTNIRYETLQRGAQQAVASINVRVAFDIYEDHHQGSPNFTGAANRLKLLNNIYVALHRFSGLILPDGQGGFEDKHFSKLLRQSLSSEKRGDGLQVYNLSFTCAMRDMLDMKQITEVQLDDIVVQKEGA